MNPFTVFIPVYNEEDILVRNSRKLIDYLDTFGAPYEIVIVSNGSTDGTQRLLGELKDLFPQVKCAFIPRKGIGSALRECMSAASYENVITVDMDLSICLDFIMSANLLLSEGCDIVVGSKRKGRQKRNPFRRFASSAFVVFARLLLGMNLNDYSPGAKAYRKKVLEDFRSLLKGGTFYVVEILYAAYRRNYKTVEIPVDCHDDRKSRFNLLHEGIYRFGNLFLLWVRSVLKKT